MSENCERSRINDICLGSAHVVHKYRMDQKEILQSQGSFSYQKLSRCRYAEGISNYFGPCYRCYKHSRTDRPENRQVGGLAISLKYLWTVSTISLPITICIDHLSIFIGSSLQQILVRCNWSSTRFPSELRYYNLGTDPPNARWLSEISALWILQWTPNILARHVGWRTSYIV